MHPAKQPKEAAPDAALAVPVTVPPAATSSYTQKNARLEEFLNKHIFT